MKIFFSIVVGLMFTTFCEAQHWVDLRDQKASFFEVQDAFQAEWQGKDYEKGQGYKQFKRWEYFMEPRVNEAGFLPPSSQIWQEYLKLKKQKDTRNTTRNGNWSFVGPLSIESSTKGIGRVNACAISPENSSVMYVGAPGGGLWKSTNGGSTWAPKTDDLLNVGVSSIAIDYVNPEIVYIGTGDGDASDTYSLGVLKSVDGGETWNTTGLSFIAEDQRNVYKIIIHPQNPNILFAAVNIGLWKSLDGGDHWYEVASGNVRDIEFHPTNPDIVYMCRPSLYRSDDGGESFTVVNDGLPSSFQMNRSKIAVSPNQPNWVYLVAVNNGFGLQGLYRSTDSGLSFEQRADGSPNLLGWSETGIGTGGQGWYDLALAVDPNNASIVSIGGVNVWRSSTGGTSWTIKAHWTDNNPAHYVHADVHVMEYFGSTLLCGSDGGIFSSSNNGNTWTNLSDGLGITQIYGVGSTDQNPGLISIGAQDNGTNMKFGNSWTRVYGADGMQTHISPTNSNRVYCATQNGGLLMSNNGGNSFTSYSFGIQETGGWLTPYEMKTGNPNTIIAGFENIWQRGNGFWTQLSDFHFATIDEIALAPSTNQYIYFSSGNKLFMTSNGGNDWDERTEGLPFIDIEGIAVDANNPDLVYVTLANYYEGLKVYKTTDAGLTWENISYNLPNVPVNCIELDGDGIYIGTDLGVFFKNDNLSNWQYFSDNLPVVVVTDIDILPNNNIVRVGTYGRGVWDSPLYTPIEEAPVCAFTSSNTSICQGGQVSFVDMSFNADAVWSWTFEGGEPATSNEAAPTVVYPTAGVYPVSLTMSNSFGEDTETKLNYITVMDGMLEEFPVSDDFEIYETFPNSNWVVVNEDDNVTWELTDVAAHSGSQSIMLDNNQGNVADYDELISKAFNLSDGSTTELTYYYAHAQKTESDHGRLKIFFSQDCGEHWIYQGSMTAGSSLSTAEPTTDLFVPTMSQWKVDTVSITSQYHLPDFRIKFQYKNDGGNVLYLDDINIDSFVGIDDWIDNGNDFSLFPNPAQDKVTLNFLQNGKASITIYNVLGEVVRELVVEEGYGTREVVMDVRSLKTGWYNLKILSDTGVAAAKFIIKRN